MKLSRTPPHPDETSSTPVDDLELIPLATIVGELSGNPTVVELARRLGDDVHLDHVGRSCVAAELASVLLFDQRRRQEEALARQARNASHVAAAARKHRAHPAGLNIGDIPDGMSPVEYMTAKARKEAGAPKPLVAAVLDGEHLVYHPITSAE